MEGIRITRRGDEDRELLERIEVVVERTLRKHRWLLFREALVSKVRYAMREEAGWPQ
jgi:hypothetical protein